MTVSGESWGPEAVQAVERLLELHAFAPWEAVPPLLQIGAAAVAAAGASPETALRAVIVTAWAASVLGAALLAGRYRGRAVGLQAAGLASLAPAKWIAVFERAEPERALCWSLLAVWVALFDSFRRRANPGRALGLAILAAALAMTLPSRWIALDLLALCELIVIAAVCSLSRPHAVKAAGVAACAALFAGVVIARGAVPRGDAELRHALAWAESQGAPWIGPGRGADLMNPILREAGKLVLSEAYPAESVLWVRAMAVRHVVASAGGKWRGQLECVQRFGAWCVYENPGPAVAAALVSRHRREKIPPVRGLLDTEALEAYLLWAERAEAISLTSRAKRLTAEPAPGPEDIVLIRESWAPGWLATEGGSVSPGPLGFIVFDPAGEARTMRLEYRPPVRERLRPARRGSGLTPGEFPAISPGGVADALDYSAGPFLPGAYLTVFGTRFCGSDTAAFLGSRRLEPLWASAVQANLQLPADLSQGSYELAVECHGRRSLPEIVEVKPR